MNLKYINSVSRTSFLILVLLLLVTKGFSATLTVSGNVFDSGTPVRNVQVFWEDSASGFIDSVSTDTSGFYSMTINTGIFSQGTVEGYIVNCNGNRVTKRIGYNPGTTSFNNINYSFCPPRGYFTATISGMISNYGSRSITVSVDTLGGVFPNVSTQSGAATGSYSLSIVSMNLVQDFWVYITDCNNQVITQKITLNDTNTTNSNVNFNYCNNAPPASHSGVITYQGNPIDSIDGFVLRYQFDPNLQNFNFIDTLSISSTGEFNFVKDTGEYLIKVMPSDSASSFFVPTYYPNGLTWDSPNSLSIDSNSNGNLSIALIVNSIGASSRSIKGNVITDTSLLKPGFGGIGVYAFDVNSEGAYFQYADNQSKFNFAISDTDGQYKVLIDQVGIPSSSRVIDFSKTSNTIVSLDIWASKEIIETTWAVGFNELEPNRNISAYPNPFSNFIQLLPDDNVHIEIFSMQGKLMNTIELFENELTIIDTQYWDKGLYVIRVRGKDYEYQKKIIKSN
ncbi:MAG: T9SS type A sorting domain-containing protein [Salibacteraceae bacterium]